MTASLDVAAAGRTKPSFVAATAAAAKRWAAAHVAALAALVGVAAIGCQGPATGPSRGSVGGHLTWRTGHALPCQRPLCGFVLPPGALLEDGLTEDEAVSIALWNNAAFQELLTDLGVARGDLIQAGLLPNPEFVYYWPAADKPLKYLLDFPIEALWLRPIRVAGAGREADRVAARLAQSGLDLMRDVRQAYADVVLAQERLKVARDGVQLRGKLAELAEKRLAAGDATPQEAATARVDGLQATQDFTRSGFDVPIMEERLRNLLGMGMGEARTPLALDPSPLRPGLEFDADALAQDAAFSRPDALAAAQAVAAADARLHFAKVGWVRVLGLADATSGRNTGHELSPAVRFTVPIFNHNQGATARAEAERERAGRNRQTVAQQIALDVQRSYLQYRQASAEREVLRAKVRPEVEAAVRRAQSAYQEGNVPYQIVLETTRQLLDSRLREAQLDGDLRRTWADLERSVGRRLAPPDAPSTEAAATETAPPAATEVEAASPASAAPPAEVDLPPRPVALHENAPQTPQQEKPL